MDQKRYFSYIRVSTSKQKKHGVSLKEQKDAIYRYATNNGLTITEWFEESETAAKRGRPVFGNMLKLLKHGKVSGVIIHKIDRSARNLKDWADLGELIDQGIDVHFAGDNLDLTSRGGRLSADIQAIVAADYIRNLREETRKGVYGRFKQGLYPLPAPLGYLDKGRGKPKEPDPVRALLVKKLFQLYATGTYSLTRLAEEAGRIGLRTKRGGTLSRTSLSTLLNNPFYMGLIRIRRTGETFRGIHEPLISATLFNRVQRILQGKTNKKSVVHDFLFRRLFSCAHCGYSLIGERQKGHIYYRCQTKGCPTKSVREEVVEGVIRRHLQSLQFSPEEKLYVMSEVEKLRTQWENEHEASLNAQKLRLSKLDTRLNRLTDAYLDGLIERDLFENRKNALMLEQKELQEHIAALENDNKFILNRLAEFLELAGSALLSYEMGIPDERREMLKIITSNRLVNGKNVDVKLSMPFEIIANRSKCSNGSPYRDTPRTLAWMCDELVTYLRQYPVNLPRWERLRAEGS